MFIHEMSPEVKKTWSPNYASRGVMMPIGGSII